MKKRKIQLSRVQAKAIRCLRKGSYRLTDPHLKEQMKSRDDIVINDLFNVIQCKDAEITEQFEGDPPEVRYSFKTERFEVIATFERKSCIVFVTAWRKKKRGQL